MIEREALHPGCTEEFSRLCALSTTDSLTARERSRFESHIRHCGLCRELVREYEDLVAQGLPLIASQIFPGQPADTGPSWNIQEAKTSLLSRLETHPAGSDRRDLPMATEVSPKFFRSPVFLNSVRYGTAVAALVLAILVAFQFGVRSGKEHAASTTSPLMIADSSLRRRIDDLEAQKARLEQALTSSQEVLNTLQPRAALAERRVKDLEAAKTSLEYKTRLLSEKSQQDNSSVERLSVQRESLERQMRESEGALAAAREELNASEEDRRRALLHGSALEAQLAGLSAELVENKAAAERQRQYLASDRDIRELMGARQLYLADVFDVDSRGNTRKPFGRVFYTQGKSLIFYAFDLDKQPGYREAKAFQAWGRPSENQAAPVSLGILYMDNESNRRWALKFDDPKVLEEISSVFVTLEPKGGSKRPTNKPFLLAYLHTAPPNHP